jgi:hypothetical protein
MTFVDELRKNRTTSSTAFIVFLQKQRPDTLHMFVEGPDDSSFYRQFVFDYYEDIKNIYIHPCGGKNQVYLTRQKIMSRDNQPNWASSMILLYFVDKDISDILEQTYPSYSDVFVTEYYSIENYLVTEEMLLFVLMDICNFYGHQKPDFDYIQEKFKIELAKFHKIIIPTMIWGIFHKTRTSEFGFDKIQLQDIFDFNNEAELQDLLPIDLEERISFFDDMCKVTTDLGEYTVHHPNVENKIKTMNPKYYVRGKYELVFFSKFLRTIVNVLKRNGIDVRYEEALMGRDNVVRTLSPRIHVMPDSIKKFLSQNIPVHHSKS